MNCILKDINQFVFDIRFYYITKMKARCELKIFRKKLALKRKDGTIFDGLSLSKMLLIFKLALMFGSILYKSFTSFRKEL